MAYAAMNSQYIVFTSSESFLNGVCRHEPFRYLSFRGD
ncbi:hypothetical protein URS_2213 [Acinetobacter ursingii]|nr:hypothetical protein URS_2213 [Acinetobacter ursingii]